MGLQQQLLFLLLLIFPTDHDASCRRPAAAALFQARRAEPVATLRQKAATAAMTQQGQTAKRAAPR